jgi:hypothetical protein
MCATSKSTGATPIGILGEHFLVSYGLSPLTRAGMPGCVVVLIAVG